jgi:RNA polymerase sigma-70 factor (ECF subfamily)
MLNPTRTNSDVEFESIAETDGDLPAVSLLALLESEEVGLMRYAFALTGRRAVAEEIVQDVFLQLHINWDHVATPRAWLYSSVRNRGLDHLRRSKREKLQCDDVQTTRVIDDGGQSPDAILCQIEDVVQLRRLLQELSENDQRLIRLKYFEERKYREISEQTGLSIGNVGYRLHHIMQHLASRLGPLGSEESK